MAALTEDRRTNRQEGVYVTLDMDAATKIYTGALVAVDAAGNALPAADASGLKVVGRAEETVDNLTGAAGDLTIMVRRMSSFWYANSSGNAVTKVNLHGLTSIYVEDDQTVSAAGGSNNIVAGKGLALDATLGVLIWVE